MKFLIDEDLPRSTGRILSEKGFHVVDVRDIGLRGATDEDIFQKAIQIKATIITADVGFANMAYLSHISHYGLILLRVPNEYSVADTNNLLVQAIFSLSENDINQNIIAIKTDKIRIRTRKQQKN